MECVLDIGGVRLRIDSARWCSSDMPYNFRPFIAGPVSADHMASLHIINNEPPALHDSEPLSTTYNDLGRASLYDSGTDWTVSLIPVPGEFPRIMSICKTLDDAVLWLRDDDPYYDFVIDSMTRIFFSQYAATCKGLMLHASVVELEGKGFIFMGESGIGKSTHSRLWIENFDNCHLLNDDCPLVVPDGKGGFVVAGTPWSGKTPCFRNKSYEVVGIARLRQAPVNRFRPLYGIEAFVSFIPGMSVMTSAHELYSEATTTALELLDSVSFGILECRPDRDAAVLNRRCLTCKHSL